MFASGCLGGQKPEGVHRSPNRGAPMKRGPTVPPAGRRGPVSLKIGFLIRFGAHEWSGWVRTCLRIHLVFVSGQTVDSRPISDQIGCLWPRPELWSARIWAWPGFGQAPLLLGSPVRDFNICLVSTADICLVSPADICPISAADICPVSTADICPVSTEDIYPVSTEDITVEDIYPVSTEDITAGGRRPAAVASAVETG